MSFDLKKASRDELLRISQQTIDTNGYLGLKVDELELKIQSQQEQISNQESEISNQEEKILTQEEQISNQAARIKWLEKQLFGIKSERNVAQDPEESTELEPPEEPPTKSTKEYEKDARKKPTKTGRVKLKYDDNVEVEEVVIWPDEIEGLSKEEYDVIGEEVTTKVHFIPARYKVVKTIRKKVKIRSNYKIACAPAPSSVIDKSFADVSFLVKLLVEKFQYHLPLYRQHLRMEELGIHISRGHLTKLVHRSLELLEPIYQSILSEVGLAETIFVDETPVKADYKSNGKLKTSYFWPFYADGQIVFVYSNSREHEVVESIISSNCKKLLSDGYSAYTKFVSKRAEMVHAQCWAHARRKFDEAKDKSPPQCDKILDIIKKLFLIERELQGKEDFEILEKRRLKSTPLVDEYFSYLNKLWYEEQITKDSLLGKAVNYSLNREQGLKVFLDHYDIPLSNNQVERIIRPTAVGRKNWLFCWTEAGAKYTAMAYTLIQNCLMNDIKPWDYFIDVLQRIDHHPAKDVHLLTPKNWKHLDKAL